MDNRRSGLFSSVSHHRKAASDGGNSTAAAAGDTAANEQKHIGTRQRACHLLLGKQTEDLNINARIGERSAQRWLGFCRIPPQNDQTQLSYSALCLSDRIGNIRHFPPYTARDLGACREVRSAPITALAPDRFAPTGMNAAFVAFRGSQRTCSVGTVRMERSAQRPAMRITHCWHARRSLSIARCPPYAWTSWNTTAQRTLRILSTPSTKRKPVGKPRRDHASAVYCARTQRPRQALRSFHNRQSDVGHPSRAQGTSVISRRTPRSNKALPSHRE